MKIWGCFRNITEFCTFSKGQFLTLKWPIWVKMSKLSNLANVPQKYTTVRSIRDIVDIRTYTQSKTVVLSSLQVRKWPLPTFILPERYIYISFVYRCGHLIRVRFDLGCDFYKGKLNYNCTVWQRGIYIGAHGTSLYLWYRNFTPDMMVICHRTLEVGLSSYHCRTLFDFWKYRWNIDYGYQKISKFD